MNSASAPSQVRRPVGRRAGFTLVEIMVVVVIIGLLATLVGPQVLTFFGDAQVTKAQSDVEALASGLVTYRLKASRDGSPPTLEKLIEPDARGNSYIQGGREALMDPWGNEYQLVPGEHPNKLVVLSFGPDRIQGTDDDIRSSER